MSEKGNVRTRVTCLALLGWLIAMPGPLQASARTATAPVTSPPAEKTVSGGTVAVASLPAGSNSTGSAGVLEDVDAALEAGDARAAGRALAPLLGQTKDGGGNDPDLSLRVGRVLTMLRYPFRATTFLEEAETLYHAAGDRQGEARAVGYLAVNEVEMVHPDAAMQDFDYAIKHLAFDPASRGSFLIEQGRLYLRMREVELGEDRFNKALELAQQARLPLLEARAYVHLGMAAVDRHHPSEGLDHMKHAVEIYAAQHQPRLEALAREHMVFPLLVQGKYDEALTQAQKAVAILPPLYEAPNDNLVSPDLGAYPTLWNVYKWKGDYDVVLASQERLLSQISDYMASQMPPAPVTPKAQSADAVTGEVEPASASSGEDEDVETGSTMETDAEAAAVAEVPPEPPHHVVEGAIYEWRGTLLHELGQVNKAMGAYTMALSIYGDAGLVEDQVRVYEKAMRLLRRSGNIDRLKGLVSDAQSLLERSDQILKGDLLRFMAESVAITEGSKPALDLLGQSIEAYESAGNLTKKGISVLTWARILDHLGDHDGATQRLEDAFDVFEEAGDQDWAKKTLEVLRERYADHAQWLRSFARKIQSFTMPNDQIWAPVMHAPLGKYANTTWLFRYLGTYDVFGDKGTPNRPLAYPFSLRALPIYSIEATAGTVQDYSAQQRALMSASSVGDKMSTAEALAAEAFYYQGYLLVGFTGDALSSAATTLEAFTKARFTRLESEVSSMMVQIYVEPGLFDTAQGILRKMADLDRQHGDIVGAASAMRLSVFHYLNQHKPRQAFAIAEEATKMAQSKGNPRLEAIFMAKKAESQLALDLPDKAIKTAELALNLGQEVRCPVVKLVSLSIIARAQHELGQTADGSAALEKARGITLDPLMVSGDTKLWLWIGDAYARMGMDDEAQTFYKQVLNHSNKKQNYPDFKLARERLAAQ